MTTYLSAVPAYGRDYKSAKAVRIDWDAGKDFLVLSAFDTGGYVNKGDLPPGVVLNIRYANRTKVCVVK